MYLHPKHAELRRLSRKLADDVAEIRRTYRELALAGKATEEDRRVAREFFTYDEWRELGTEFLQSHSDSELFDGKRAGEQWIKKATSQQLHNLRSLRPDKVACILDRGGTALASAIDSAQSPRQFWRSLGFALSDISQTVVRGFLIGAMGEQFLQRE